MTSTNPFVNEFISPVIDLCSASFGAMVSSLVGYPLDTIKTKMQIYPNLYRNSYDCAKKTIKMDGIHGLYSGVRTGMMGEVIEKSVLFCAYGISQKIICQIRERQKTSVFDDAMAGFFGAFWASLAMCPNEVIKCKLQALRETGLDSHMNHYQIVAKILREEGLRGFYTGLTSTMFREMPGYFFYFGGYRLTLSYLNYSEEDDRKQAILKTSTAGGIASLCFWLTIFPFDTVKSRIQVESPHESMFSVFRQILVMEGIKDLYKGLTPTLVRMVPVTAVLFVTYESTRSYLSRFVSNNSSKRF